MYGEKSFSKKKFANRLNIGLPLRACVEKTVHEVETH